MENRAHRREVRGVLARISRGWWRQQREAVELVRRKVTLARRQRRGQEREQQPSCYQEFYAMTRRYSWFHKEGNNCCKIHLPAKTQITAAAAI